MPASDVASRNSLHPIAELYGRWALNPLVDVASAIAHDVAVRPNRYKQLSAKTVSILNDFRFKLGTDAEWPNAFQRTLSFRVLYHASLASPPLREAALLYCRGGQKDDDPLLDAFRDAAAGFRARIEPLVGDALAMLVGQTGPIFDHAVALFQDEDVAQAFGLPSAPSSNWPLGGDFSGDGAYLVAAIVRGLRESACLAGWYRRLSRTTPNEQRLMPLLAVALPADKFLTLQKAAYFGALTMSRVLDKHDGDERELINLAYKWTKALQRLVPDVARAWKDLEYRARLTDLEWGMSPNPSGDTALPAAAPVAATTYTVSDEICCCSGDLDCDPTSQLTDFCSEYQCPQSVIAFAGCG